MPKPALYPKPEILHGFPKTGHAFIEASAGTGKTFTIEHLIVDLLIETELTLDEVLVVTFTEKATAELRGRVREMLTKVLRHTDTTADPATAWRIGARLRDKLERTLFSFETAPIHTIHSFCRRVLSENAFHNRQLFAQELVDGRTAFGRSFKKVLRKTLAREPQYNAMLAQVLEYGDVDTLEDRLYECHRAKAEFFPVWNPEAIAQRVDRIAELLEVSHLADEIGRACVYAPWKAKAVALWEAMVQVIEAWRENRDVLAFLQAFAALPGLESVLKEPRAVKPKPKEGLTLLYPHDLSPQNQELMQLLATLADNMVTADAVIVQTFLPLVQAQLRADKQAEGFYDFDDMLQWVAEGLDDPDRGPALRAALRQQYRVALIDEFQDTDATQWSIFRSVFMDAPHRLIVVGDPKQAIYGFRGGDFHTYLAAIRDIHAAGGYKTSLPENRRSSNRMIGAYNKILDQGAAQPFFPGPAVRYADPVHRGGDELRACDAKGNDVPPIRLIAYSNVEAGAERMRQAVGRTIAAEIRRITDPGAVVLEGDIAPDDRQIKLEDVFVLTRSRREGLEIADYLAEAGVPFAFYKQDGLFQGEEAVHIADLLAAVADPSPSLRMRAFATPFFAVEWRQLERCRDVDDGHALVQRLQAWKALGDREQFGALFGLIVEQSGLLRRELLFSRGERRLTNYLHIFEILLEASQQKRCTLAELVQYLRDLIANRANAPGEDGGVQRLESERNAVKILTMHKSKGLQAKAVFLFGGFHRGNGSKFSTVVHDAERRRLQVLGSLGWYPALKQAVQEEEDQEERRVLYVAITRARALLYLPVIGELKSKPGGPYAPLNQRLRDLLPEIAEQPALRDWFAVLEIGDLAPPASAQEAAPEELAGWTPPAELLAEPAPRCDYPALLAAHAPIEIGSYSRMRGGHSRFLSPPKGDLPGGANTGNCLHEILEAVPFETIGTETRFDEWKLRPEIRQIFQRTLYRYAIDPNRFLERTQELVFQALTTPLQAGGSRIPALAQCRRHPEMEFHIPIPLPAGAMERGFIKGVIDLVFEHEAKIYFADWKSDTLRTYAPAEMNERLDHDYFWQERLYTLGIVRLLEIADASSFEERFGGFFYVFLRGVQPGGRGVLFRKPSWEQVAIFEHDVARYYAESAGVTHG
jgi:exodeoxyribonuclease V beta subunit